MVFEGISEFSHAAFDLLPWRLRDPWSYEISRLGRTSLARLHGRLHPQNAATLFALVKQQGVGATTIVVSGQSAAVARRRH